MEKQKRWQFYLIAVVMALTLYSILPTVFYYSQPLKQSIDAEAAKEEARIIVGRINNLEELSKEWLSSFCKLLAIKPTAIDRSQSHPGLIELTFKSNHDAAIFRQFFPLAGASIPFVPAQLKLANSPFSDQQNKVGVARQIDVDLASADYDKLFQFSPLRAADGAISPLYREVVNGRVEELALAFGAPSRQAVLLDSLVKTPADTQSDESVITLARDISEMTAAFPDESALKARYYSSFTQIDGAEGDLMITTLLNRLVELKKKTDSKQHSLENELATLAEQGVQVGVEQKLQLSMLSTQSAILNNAREIIERRRGDFTGKKPLERKQIAKQLGGGKGAVPSLQVVSLEGRNPFVEALAIDWSGGKILLRFYSDLAALRESEEGSEFAKVQREKINQYLINDIAFAAQRADEQIIPIDSTFGVALNALSDTQSFLALNLGHLSALQSGSLIELLKNEWQPQHADLIADHFPIYTYEQFQKLPLEEQKLGFVIYSPASSQEPIEGLHPGSIYIIAKGLDAITQKYRDVEQSGDGEIFYTDLQKLHELLQLEGFISYFGSDYQVPRQFGKDLIFELKDYYGNLLKATREDFYVKGNKRYALLDFTDFEQRLLTRNKIDDRIQEDLLKWQEAYSSAQAEMELIKRYSVPAPTRNPYWENFKLSFKKYFRGDQRKILKWGLDLSGGKTVRIGLRDHSNRPVTNPDDLNQAVNELYVRVNKMGIAERTIHIENDNIVLVFPGSQALSATELIKASAMYFHIVNEKFSRWNSDLKEAVEQFLLNVWNEAVVTNRKDIESINLIAWNHLGAENSAGELTLPMSAVAKILYDNGLRIVNPLIGEASHAFNDTLSAIGMMNDDLAAREGQPHPLTVIFHNYALEGANLRDVRVGYDPTQGNNLSFGVKPYYEGANSIGSPQESFYEWTSQFAADKIVGTSKEIYSQREGWRMAVILNGTIISNPRLNAALREGGTITGRFSQREINQLAADLKAGSLSFTPRLLSEENVSPELGAEERMHGIVASVVGLVALFVAMIAYYHFAGIVASCAVLINLLIMWAVLQGFGAALSLPTVAGIVLSLAMAVDANVLVFERIREEFALSGRIASAVQTGYKKAFSAIIDSNITTIIAAIILIQFDSGPIKGFAVALIIGIASSMFTSLFMTRYYFAGWVHKPANRSLKMSSFFNLTNFDFLSHSRKAIAISILAGLSGLFLFVAQHKTMLAMDFTGGYALNLEVEAEPLSRNYRERAFDALVAAGATPNEVQVLERSRPNQLHIQLGIGMEEEGRPFYQLPELATIANAAHSYRDNLRLAWVVDALDQAGLHITPQKLTQLEQNWTAMSGQFSQVMRNNALKGLGAALLAILIYITLRFEFIYGVAAIVGLVHDVIITMGVFAFVHWLGLPVSIDLSVIGAIMTLVGYSLNDMIIVFDRIREDSRHLRKMPFRDIINHALNVTLSRTVMTSGTTLLVLLSLLFLGGQAIMAFSLVMALGVFVGTLSSLFIAAPLVLWLRDYELSRQAVNIKALARQ